MKAKETQDSMGATHGVIGRLPGTTDRHSGDDPVVRARLAQLYREIDIFHVECAALLQALQALLRHIEWQIGQPKLPRIAWPCAASP